MKTYKIEFDTIAELQRKIDVALKSLRLHDKEYRNELRSKGIPFEEIDDYGVFFDADKLTKEQLDFIKNRPSSWYEVMKMVGIEYTTKNK